MRVVDIVSNILQTSRQARNSDKHLIIKFMAHYGIHLNATQQSILMNMPSFETARRIRQKLQQEGKYTPDQTIADDRNFRGMRTQQMMPKLKSDQIEKITEAPTAVSWLYDE